mmetsp:Transcript_7835/g.12140  ORF Transcript_7835/g.12140 Transcript_7835/m.12140 type:complete len:86 (-) Transcript_7835:532-789(-)
MVVAEPMECATCSSLFCKRCLEPWLVNNDYCPKKCDGTEPSNFKEVNRFVLNNLLSLKFTCKNEACKQEPLPYKTAIDHIGSCEL